MWTVISRNYFPVRITILLMFVSGILTYKTFGEGFIRNDKPYHR
jgi:hypothetical protein